jgi:glycosyltransferase involved in cell wall biosynthesis
MPDKLSICVCTVFYPSVGGIETLTEELAQQWTAAGHRVTIVTNQAVSEPSPRRFEYEVLHRPSAERLLRTVRRCQIFVQNNISLKLLWPILCVPRRLILVHHGWYGGNDQTRTVRERFKVHLARRCSYNICVSSALSREMQVGGVVIPNLYRESCFRLLPESRDKDLIFVGRLVSDKGADVLLRALGRLRSRRCYPTLSIVGEGPERPCLEHLVRTFGLGQQVRFLGLKNHDELPPILNQHRVMIVPSLVPEGFGLVALEGAACGCVVVASSHGGLPEAVGPCGVTFPPGDDGRLADILRSLVECPESLETYRVAAPAHLAHHRPETVSARYLDLFAQAVKSSR